MWQAMYASRCRLQAMAGAWIPDGCAGAALLRVVLVTVVGALPARPPATAYGELLRPSVQHQAVS